MIRRGPLPGPRMGAPGGAGTQSSADARAVATRAAQDCVRWASVMPGAPSRTSASMPARIASEERATPSPTRLRSRKSAIPMSAKQSTG